MWPVYHGLMRADFTLFDEYEHKHTGAQDARSFSTLSPTVKSDTASESTPQQPCCMQSASSCSSATADDQHFEFPIVAYWGARDRKITAAMVSGWQRFTTGSFELIKIDGHHLWPLVKEAKAQWLSSIVEHMIP